MKTKRPLKLRKVNRQAEESRWTPAAPMKAGDKILLLGKVVVVRGSSA